MAISTTSTTVATFHPNQPHAASQGKGLRNPRTRPRRASLDVQKERGKVCPGGTLLVRAQPTGGDSFASPLSSGSIVQDTPGAMLPNVPEVVYDGDIPLMAVTTACVAAITGMS
jgi:hypothetical protein